MKFQDHTFVFVIGLHASGTSLLARLLKKHPQISGFEHTGVPEDEGQHLQNVIPTAKSLGGPGMFAFHPDAAMDENHELATEETRRRLLEQWEYHWNPDRPCLLEKSPPTLIRTRFFQALFPGCFFICLTRHPVAVAYGTQIWSDTTTQDLLDHWLKAHERFSRDREHLQHVLTLSYEEFLVQPDQVLSRIQSFLGLSQAPLPVPDVIEDNAAYFETWRKFRDNSNNEFDRFVERHEASIRSFGYSLTDLEWQGPSRLQRSSETSH